MQITLFKNDALGVDSFEGFTKGETWNGWDCPYFNFEQAQKVLKAYNQLRSIIGEPQAFYDPNTDAFIFPIEDESEIYASIMEDGGKYYSIGGFVWIWEESELLTNF